MLRFVQQHEIQLVLPMTDATVEPLAGQRDVFRGKAELVLASPAALAIVSDKYQTICLAQELGIPTPETRLIRSLEDIPDFTHHNVPTVIKDRYSARWEGDQAVPGSVAYAYSKEELQTKVAQRLQAAKDVLIQEFVPGRGVGFSCFVVDGEVYLPFQWERIREKDPRGSGSSARRSVPLDQQVFRMGRDLLTRTGFQGICMVEFKQDTRNGRLSLMEINGRPWGSIQLPIHCGVDYPRHLIDWHLQGLLPPKWIDYKTGITCKWLTAELVHLENLWQGKPAGWPVPYPNFWTSLLKIAIPWYPGLRYDDISLSDPKPGLAELAWWFRRHLGGNDIGRR
jgi:predicted ATP-grasp superfamily ATP-dependent carboligase